MSQDKLSLYYELIKAAANTYVLDPNLVAAFCIVESSLDPQAMRYEDHWKWFYKVEECAKKNHITIDTETQLQKFSWGMMQVMGSVAREVGYLGSLLNLSLPTVGLDLGCRKLSSLVQKYDKLSDAIVSYNAGSPRRKDDGTYVNQSYLDKILKAHDKCSNT